MSEIIRTGLTITAIGMGLVFAAIILLWGLMILLVRFGAEREEKSNPETRDSSTLIIANAALEQINPEYIAALAVAMALSENGNRIPALPPGESVSPWLQVQRTRVLQGKSNLYSSRLSRRM
jgi:Na+-transporting methylmalonyl-CoA/oxaloacetate decarboxylase gamma subunit